MNVIIHSGTKKDRLRKRCVSLSKYVNTELHSPGEKGKVYDFKDWSYTKIKSNSLGNERNGSKMKEFQEIKRDFKKKGDIL